MNKNFNHLISFLNKAGKLLIASGFIIFSKVIIAQGGPPVIPPPCTINPLTFTQQAGFGNNNKMIIGGFGQNDGLICWNCYADSSYYGRQRAYNMPSGSFLGGSPTPNWTSRIFQDIPSNVLRIQSGDAACYDSIQWKKGISVLATGGVGIGTDNTFGAMLAVNGMIYTKADVEINETFAWPDYVFTSAYKLPSIRDFEKQVMALGYIPQIGSALQLQQNGHRLGEMQTKQMEVIEIMLRHQFELNARLEKIEKENIELKMQIEKIINAFPINKEE